MFWIGLYLSYRWLLCFPPPFSSHPVLFILAMLIDHLIPTSLYLILLLLSHCDVAGLYTLLIPFGYLICRNTGQLHQVNNRNNTFR